MTKRIFFLAAVTFTLLACSGDYSPEKPLAAELTFDDIQYWVGEGENRAMLVAQWNDGKNPDALAYGYRWSGTKYGYDMIDDIAKADKRFFYLRFSDLAFGYAMGGIGFNASGSNNVKLGNGSSCESPVDGSIDADAYDFDDWKLCDDANTRWQAGWYGAYWSYWVTDIIDGKWKYSDLGASSRVLVNNSVDAWYFDINLNDPEFSTFFRCMEDPDNCDGRNFFGTIIPVSEIKP
jgi:hypothetical protein